MNGFPGWAVANLKMFFRDRSTLFWALVFPLLFMGLLGLGFGRSDAIDFRVGVVDQDHTAWSLALWTTLDNDSLPFSPSNYTDPTAAVNTVGQGNLDVVLVIPEGFGAFMANEIASGGAGNGTLRVPIYWGVSERGSGPVAVTALQETLDAFYQAATGSQKKLGVAAEPVNQASLEYIDFLAPGILAMSIMQNGVFGLSLFIVSAREKKILKRLRGTPANAAFVLAGRIVPALLIGLVQTALLLAVAVFGFGVKIVGNLVVLLVVTGFGALVFITLGFLISSVSKTADSAESLTNVVTLPMFFLGGVFIPIDRLPAAVQYIAYAMPLTYFSDALRAVMLHNSGFGDIAVGLGVLTVFAVGVFALAVKLFRWE